jgi:hypothetical protein
VNGAMDALPAFALDERAVVPAVGQRREARLRADGVETIRGSSEPETAAAGAGSSAHGSAQRNRALWTDPLASAGWYP